MNIEITNLFADPNDAEIVAQVEFCAFVEKNGKKLYQNHCIQLLPIEKTDPNFVSFKSITEQKVCEWIVKTVGQEYLDTMEQNILLQDKQTAAKLPFPWI